MALNIGLSGLTAASKDLEVTGNNIANSNTVGFKGSRTEFGDVFATTANSASNASGKGVRVLDIAQQFSQGTTEFTENALDLAVNGNGFFVLEDASDQTISYTRNGQFQVDREGYVVNSNGQYLQGFEPLESGNVDTLFSTGALSPIQLDAGNAVPNATTSVTAFVNLPSEADLPTEAWAWPDPTDPLSPTTPDPDMYNFSTALTVYDSLGTPRSLTLYFVKPDDGATPPAPVPLEWNVYVGMELVGDDGRTYMQSANGGDDETAPAWTADPVTLTFNSEGYIPLDPTATPPLDGIFGLVFPETGDFENGANPLEGEINFGPTLPYNAGSGSTQYGTQFDVNELNQDGSTTGRVASVDVDNEGRIFARYTNGQSSVLGQVALADFTNVQGLAPLGDNNWGGTFVSGDPVYSAAGTGTLGTIEGSALESSNVDLAAELVNLIIAQRSFEANSKTIQTSDQITQTVLNLR